MDIASVQEPVQINDAIIQPHRTDSNLWNVLIMIELKRLGDSSLQPADIANGQKKGDLRQLANDMIDAQLTMIADCTDADVAFTPIDEAADDPHAVSEAEVGMAWTLGHVIVHCCASSEESTFLAAELARGIENHGRSRYEPHWSTIKTIRQCREALEESRRMRLATLEVWPRRPNLDIRYEVWPGGPVANAMELYVVGHMHEYSHFDQIREIVRQAQAART